MSAKTSSPIKRILLVSPAYAPVRGGLAEQATVLAEEFAARKHNVNVVTEKLGGDLPSHEIVNGVSIERLFSPKKRNIFNVIAISFKLALHLLKGNGKYDLCIIRTITSQALIAGILKSLGLIKYKTLITADSGGDHDEIRALTSRPFFKIMVYFLNKNDFINSSNSANYEHYLELGFTKEKLTKIYNGIIVTDYKSCRYPRQIRDFNFMAELNREKGVRELLDAFVIVHRQFTDTTLRIGGYGKEEGYIEDYITQHKLSQCITFDGYIEKVDKRAFFEKGDCFVFPSYSEGYGLVIAEAVLYKRAVISTKVADVEAIFGPQITFCEIKDTPDLAKKMKEAIESYQPGKLNYDKIIEEIRIERTAGEFLNLIAS